MNTEKNGIDDINYSDDLSRSLVARAKGNQAQGETIDQFMRELAWCDWMSAIIDKEDNEDEITERETKLIDSYVEKIWEIAEKETEED